MQWTGLGNRFRWKTTQTQWPTIATCSRQCWLAAGNYNLVYPACSYLFSQCWGLWMASGYRCIIPEQQVVHGSTDDLTATNHYSSFPCNLDTCTTESKEKVKTVNCAFHYKLTQTALEPSGQFKSGSGTSAHYFSSGLCVIGNWNWEGGWMISKLVLLLSEKAEMKCGISRMFQHETQCIYIHNSSYYWRLLHSWIMDGNLLTCLPDKFHASFRRTGNKAVSKVPSREFPSIDAT